MILVVQVVKTTDKYLSVSSFLWLLLPPVRFDDSMWACQELPACFLNLLRNLQFHVRTGLLPHFFVPDYNLFSAAVFPKKTLAFLFNALEEQRREGLPLLKPPAPLPLLRLMSPSGDNTSQISSDQSSILTAVCSLDTAFVNKLVLVFAVAVVCILLRMQVMGN